jgi:arylsulfatase A-like enzyme
MFAKLKYYIAAIVLIGVSGFAAWKYENRSSIKPATGYNVVVISLDTTRADFLGCYGNKAAATPNIDRIAAEGVLFENYYSTINTTLAAHSSMFTGLYPRNHGVGRNSMRLNNKNLTIAEYLHSRGYNTAAFIGSFALASVFGINQGFTTFEESFIGSASDYIERNVLVQNQKHQQLEVLIPKTNVGHIERSAPEVNKAFFQWLDANASSRFFAFIHYYDPHFPYSPPPEYRRKHLASIPEGTPMNQAERIAMEASFKQIVDPSISFDPSQIQNLPYSPVVSALLKMYLGEIEAVDTSIGQVLNVLDQKGLRSKTVIIITADHGENLVEHWNFDTFFRHGFLTHESETHVPLIVSCPGILPPGRRVTTVASQIDFTPTLLNLLGIEYSFRTDGISLAEYLFRDRREPDRQIFAEASQPHVKIAKEAKNMIWVNDGNGIFVRKNDYKYVKIPFKQYEAVFDISTDRREIKDLLSTLSTDNNNLIVELKTALETWKKTAMSGNIDEKFQLSEEDRERLESLGYVGD